MSDGLEREALRQRLLLRTLMRQGSGATLNGWLRPLRRGTPAQRGVASYRANAGAAIERALAAAYPTVHALMGEESFAAMARAYWHAHPPLHGDLALAGDALPEFIAASASLDEVPYLADVARLDAAMDAAERAADGAFQADTLALLGDHDPARLAIDFLPGTAVLASPYPVLTIREAHSLQGDDPFAAARQALSARRGEQVLVYRDGFRAKAVAVDASTARWTQALLAGATLAQAFAQFNDDFDFQRWLMAALEHHWLARVRVAP